MSELFDYVLEHSIDINELTKEEKEKLIYKEKENKLEKGYVYSSINDSKRLVLK